MRGKPIADVVEDIAKRLDVRMAGAKARLIEACHGGLIRAYWRGHYSRQSPPIYRNDWVGADVDIRRQLVILANGERMAFVDIDLDDYEAWLQAQSAATSPAMKTASAVKVRTQDRRERAKQAIAAEYPLGVPSRIDLSNVDLCAKVTQRIKTDCEARSLRVPSISDDTILRAAGRK